MQLAKIPHTHQTTPPASSAASADQHGTHRGRNRYHPSAHTTALPVGAAVRTHSRPLVLSHAARLAPPAAQLAVDKLRDMRKVTGRQQTLVGAKLVSGERVHGVQAWPGLAHQRISV